MLLHARVESAKLELRRTVSLATCPRPRGAFVNHWLGLLDNRASCNVNAVASLREGIALKGNLAFLQVQCKVIFTDRERADNGAVAHVDCVVGHARIYAVHLY